MAYSGGEGMSDPGNGHATVSLIDNPDGIACLRVIGEVDLAIASALDTAFAEITAVSRPAVYVDLGGVRFADSTMVHFVCRVCGAMPEGTLVLLCRPNGMTRFLAELCSLDSVATITAQLPSDFSSAP
jgi:anti-anti-sigma factor